MHIFILFFLFSGCLLVLLISQTISAQTPDSSRSISSRSSNSIPSELTAGQAFLLSRSSYVILTESHRLSPGSLLGFSFRTCLPAGELLRQIGLSQDTFILSLTEAGSLLLVLETGATRHSLQVGGGLANGAWHTVRLVTAADRSAICLNVDGDAECGPRRTGPSIVMAAGNESATTTSARLEEAAGIVAALEAAAGSAQLRLGSGLVGCVREGPGVRLSERGKVGSFAGIEWGACTFPPSCAGGN
jgi:Laminin G domain